MKHKLDFTHWLCFLSLNWKSSKAKIWKTFLFSHFERKTTAIKNSIEIHQHIYTKAEGRVFNFIFVLSHKLLHTGNITDGIMRYFGSPSLIQRSLHVCLWCSWWPIKPLQPTSTHTLSLPQLWHFLYKVCLSIFLSIGISSSLTTRLDVSDIRTSCSELPQSLQGDGPRCSLRKRLRKHSSPLLTADVYN